MKVKESRKNVTLRFCAKQDVSLGALKYKTICVLVNGLEIEINNTLYVKELL